MEGILSWFRRLRHSRGFGIHSPFAYRFITHTLRQPYAYYAYSGLTTPEQRLLFRVALAFGARSPFCAGLDKNMTAAVILAKRKDIDGSIDSHDFIAVDAVRAEKSDIADAADSIVGGTPAIIYNSSEFPLAAVLGRMTAGMTFANGKGTVIIAPLPHLPRQDFDVRF
ncbi:MAG: hypothetical protein J6C67_06635 [Muribaculaceae bacterium]|nr:hypothetical protein [Muribaculaceae bacterium]